MRDAIFLIAALALLSIAQSTSAQEDDFVCFLCPSERVKPVEVEQEDGTDCVFCLDEPVESVIPGDERDEVDLSGFILYGSQADVVGGSGSQSGFADPIPWEATPLYPSTLESPYTTYSIGPLDLSIGAQEQPITLEPGFGVGFRLWLD